MKIGIALKAIRIKRGLTQSQAAKKINISQTYLSQIEGNKKKATADMVEAICKVYDTPMQIVIWNSIDDSMIGKNKKRSYKELKPLMDNLINQMFS